MADEPHFPAPERREGDRAAEPRPRPATEPEAPKPAVIVRRADPASDEPAPKAAPKLTPDEVRALLAVEGVKRSRWSRTAIRGGIIIIPTGVISLFLDMILGAYAPFVSALVVLGALAWVAWPLLRRDEWS
jgi:hypothetical protein